MYNEVTCNIETDFFYANTVIYFLFRFNFRHWLVTKGGLFKNISREARIVLITTKIEGPHLVLSAPDIPPLQLKISPSPDECKQVDIK